MFILHVLLLAVECPPRLNIINQQLFQLLHDPPPVTPNHNQWLLLRLLPHLDPRKPPPPTTENVFPTTENVLEPSRGASAAFYS